MTQHDHGSLHEEAGKLAEILEAYDRAEEAGNGVQVGYNIPKEGAGSFFDMLAIPADAKNVEAAHVFLDYLMRPEVIAEIGNFTQFPTGNAAAVPLADEALRNDPGVYPTPEVLKKIYTFPDLPAGVQRNMTRSWTKIKSGR